MKIVLAQQNYHIGNIEGNTKKIIEAIKAARQQAADLIVFSELSVCGYQPKDFLYFNDFINKCEQAIDEIKLHADGIAVIVGAPQRNPVVKGKDLFNAAFFLAEKKIQQVVHKTCLPTYDVFDEDRYFEPATEWNIVPYKNKKIAITICEDIWNLGDNPLYNNCPMDILISQQPDVMINISASPFDYTHDADRKAAVKANVLKYKIPLFYCNAVGSQTEIVFDGTSLVFDKAANLCGRLASFKEDMQSFILNEDGSVNASIILQAQHLPDTSPDPATLDENLNIENIYKALVLGIKDYFEKMGFKKAILGSSGGIDSAVTLALACEALGSQNVRAILMPSQYSTSHSISDAEQLSIHLKNEYNIIPIKNIYEAFINELQPLFKNLPFNIAEENIQSRSRGNLLMAIANKFGYILLNTSNKSELSTGYGTLYGDMAGGLGVLGDC
ncbi:MAG: NAD(+) synthase, partial [Bacteroidetes bacterium]|nr:NAD(+) synthase [Bacteroidota bacterium]